MTTTHTSIHKGYRITTRCCSTANNRFEASFTVFPPLGAGACWQQFAQGACKTAEAATAEALGAAMRLVDSDERMSRASVFRAAASEERAAL
jgi:hypothetical protein